MTSERLRTWAMWLATLGIVGVLVMHYLVFFWVPTEATQGIIQMIFYIHVPAAWVAFMAFGVSALCSAVYLWLGEEHMDEAAVSAAEGGMVFTTVVLVTGPLWAKIAWGTYWTWDPRLTFTLLLWFIYLGYFMVRGSSTNPERGKRFSAVVSIVGALDIPLIHMSVQWFRGMHPGPVVMKPGSPTLSSSMLVTLMVGLVSFTLLFWGLFFFRYTLAVARHAVATRERGAAA